MVGGGGTIQFTVNHPESKGGWRLDYMIYFKPTWIKFPANGGWGGVGGGVLYNLL